MRGGGRSCRPGCQGSARCTANLGTAGGAAGPGREPSAGTAGTPGRCRPRQRTRGCPATSSPPPPPLS